MRSYTTLYLFLSLFPSHSPLSTLYLSLLLTLAPSVSPTPSLPLSVIVEAVKCLCNLVLTDHSLAASCTELGVLHGLSLRLRLVRNVDLPPDILTFDLRLLFLITACGVEERYMYERIHCTCKPLRLLYSLIVYEIVNFLSSLFTLCYFFLSFYI